MPAGAVQLFPRCGVAVQQARSRQRLRGPGWLQPRARHPIGAAEEPLGELRVRASAAQAGPLVAWAAPWPERTWAVEGAGGLGHLLAQQLVAAGERVLDVPPKLASRVRLRQAGDTNKNDPGDALSVAVAALRSKARRQVAAEDHAAVLKVTGQAAPGPGPLP